MATFMYVLRPTEKSRKTVCPTCASRGEVLDSCPVCHGTATKGYRIQQYYVQDRPIQIDKIDRDPRTGILRYWETMSDYYSETTYPDINKYVPEVPHGVHLCHAEKKWAEAECARINKYLAEKAAAEKVKDISFNF